MITNEQQTFLTLRTAEIIERYVSEPGFRVAWDDLQRQVWLSCNFFVFLRLYITNARSGVSGKGFLAPGNGKGNLKSHARFTGRERETENATGREGNGKFEARNPGNPGKCRESYKIKVKI